MNNPALLIYDNTGHVWSVFFGETSVPEGIQGIIADVPEGFASVTVNPTTKIPSFTLGEAEKLKSQIYYTAMMTDTLQEG